MYHGDIRLSDTINIKFTTRQISGAPFTLAGSPVISAYPSNSTTQLTAGITLSVDFDGVTGLNNIAIVASGANGYLTATDYALVITTGTVNSVSVVGECVGSFSIEHRSALMPTTAALTLDVSAGGEAGVDWGNVGSKTTTNALTGTSISAVTTLTTYTGNTVQTGDSYARLGAPVGASISADIAEIEAETDDIAAVKVQTDKLAFTVTNQVDANVLDWKSATAPAMTGDAFARLGAPTGASVSADIAAIRVDTNTTIPNLIAALNNISSANVKTQVVAALNTDTYAEPGQGTPSATTTLQLKISYLYKAFRNRTDQTATTYKLYNDDAATVDQKATVSDDGTVFSKTELVTGP